MKGSVFPTVKAEARAFLPFLAAMIPVVALICAFPVPHGNEYFYLLRLEQAWHPGLLAHDWTFASGGSEHKIFNLLFGFPTLFMPVAALAWAGRVLSWILILHSLYRIAGKLGISRAAAWLSILVWIALGQSPVSGEWILGGFEAKTIAYPLLFYALERAMSRKPVWAGLLMGLSFTIHPAVGLWGGLALTATLPFQGYTPKDVMKVMAAGFAAALPGAVPLLLSMAADHDSSREAWRFLLLGKMPYHFDPGTWGRRAILPLYLMLLACALFVRAGRDRGPLRHLVLFMAVSGIFFSLGILFRYTETYALLSLMPFRVFAVTCPLFFFFCMSAALAHWERNPLPGPAVAAALFGCMALGDPLGKAMDIASANRKAWSAPESGYVEALRWIGSNTPPDAVAVLPPWRRENGYYSRRAQVASFLFNPYDRLDQWVDRLRLLVGEVPFAPFHEQVVSMEGRYRGLPPGAFLESARAYGAGFALSESDLPFPLLHNSDTWKVYRIPADPAP